MTKIDDATAFGDAVATHICRRNQAKIEATASLPFEVEQHIRERCPEFALGVLMAITIKGRPQ